MVDFPKEEGIRKIKTIREQEAEELAQVLSKKYELPYADLSKMTIEVDALKLIPEETARMAKIVAFQKIGKKVQVAILSPNPKKTQSILKELAKSDYKLTVFMVSEVSLEHAWERYIDLRKEADTLLTQGVVGISSERLEKLIGKAKHFDTFKKIITENIGASKKRGATSLLEVILAGAIGLDASDIHLEPHADDVRFRLRIDGVLHDISRFDTKNHKLLLSRIKLVSGLKLNVHSEGQDGRFSIRLKDVDIEIRTSIIPGPYGESTVLRILNPKSIAVSLEDLGINEYLYNILIEEIKKPNGMIFTTGPTGSGKTTTLYAFIKKVYRPELKIITLEDPIEYHLKGITQTQVEESRGYTFSEGLRSILRQDPDVLMIGEVRDLETARISMHSALTGHLVFSTIHTNDAAGTIPRLVDLGVDPNIIAPAINLSIAQRLVRNLCTKCKVIRDPKPEEIEKLEKIIATFPEKIKRPDLEGLKLYDHKGCDECSGIGYKGRIGVFEAILIDDEMEQLILSRPSESAINKVATKPGIPNMKQDGIMKVIEGKTTLEELRRVVEL